ncbi:uncharacterized protein LOC141915247 [Tubulanus polymorphus]|uniref:uncharacterized protein LOC141915247 n=1 Tax=Tubulanus polymorphus TaxID=672921 RepID=UPI003DA554AE
MSSPNAGLIVGVTIPILLLVAIGIGLIWWFWLRKKVQCRGEPYEKWDDDPEQPDLSGSKLSVHDNAAFQVDVLDSIPRGRDIYEDPELNLELKTQPRKLPDNQDAVDSNETADFTTRFEAHFPETGNHDDGIFWPPTEQTISPSGIDIQTQLEYNSPNFKYVDDSSDNEVKQPSDNEAIKTSDDEAVVPLDEEPEQTPKTEPIYAQVNKSRSDENEPTTRNDNNEDNTE